MKIYSKINEKEIFKIMNTLNIAYDKQVNKFKFFNLLSIFDLIISNYIIYKKKIKLNLQELKTNITLTWNNDLPINNSYLFYLNGNRLDNPKTGINETIDNKSCHLEIRFFTEGKEKLSYALDMRPSKLFYRTRHLAIINCLIVLNKVINNKCYIFDNTITTQLKTYRFSIVINFFKSRLKKQTLIKSNWKLKYIDNQNNIKTIIQAREDAFIADPFVFSYDNDQYIFAEELDYTSSIRKGVIVVYKQVSIGKFERLGVALDRPYHLSFPNIFTINSQIYMIPETGSIKEMQLYKCLEFPLRWKLEKILLKGENYSDTIYFRYNNIDFLFTSYENEINSANSQLFLYYSDDILKKEITFHPMCPIQVGCSTSRMAGRIVQRENKIYRVAQDCNKRYGNALVFNEILELSCNCYKEKYITRLENNKSDVMGIHTYNENELGGISDEY